MDYRVLSPVEITNIIDSVSSAKLCGTGYSNDNILFYVTNGSQFAKLLAKCGKSILDKPNQNGEFYVNELIRVRLLQAVETNNEYHISMYASFFESIVNDFGYVPVMRISQESKECPVHTLFKNKGKHKRISELYEFAVGKIPKRQGVSIADADGNNIYGEPAEAAAPLTPRRVISPRLLSVSLSEESTTPPVTPPATPLATPTSKSSSAPLTTLPEEQRDTSDTWSVDINPFTGKRTPSACITILKGYETHFFNPNFTSYLKSIRK